MPRSCPVCGHKTDVMVRDRTEVGFSKDRLRYDAEIHKDAGMIYIHWEDED